MNTNDSIDIDFVLFFTERDASGDVKISGIATSREELSGCENIRFPVKNMGWAYIWTNKDSGALEVQISVAPLGISESVLQPLVEEYLVKTACLEDFLSSTPD